MSKILVVDDDQDILLVMQALLKMNGYDVAVTPRGEEALSKAASFQPHLVLLDVRLSGHDGREICTALKADPLTQHIPVVMVSAHSSGVADFERYGADDFIAKPFDVKNLLDRIRTTLAGKVPAKEELL